MVGHRPRQVHYHVLHGLKARPRNAGDLAAEVRGIDEPIVPVGDPYNWVTGGGGGVERKAGQQPVASVCGLERVVDLRRPERPIGTNWVPEDPPVLRAGPQIMV